jgi:DNA-binding transcriptional regulator YbjK
MIHRVAARSNVQDRRTLIAEAALELLAREGARGLTHRGVDRELALPDGSTSYYYSTRSALLLAAAERLVVLDMADIDAIPDSLAGVAALVELWLSPAHRTRSLARVELLLTSARDPAFRFMQEARSQFIERAGRGATPAAARIAGLTLTALADGLLMHGLVTGGASRRELRGVLEQLAPAAKGSASSARVSETKAKAKRPRTLKAKKPKRAARK